MGNDDFKKNQAPVQNKQQDKKEKSRRQILTTSIIVYAVLFLVLYIIVNINSISSIFTKVLNVLAPLVIGAAIAYLINPLMRLLESHALSKIKHPKARRALSMVITYIIVCAFIALFVFLIVPELVDSVNELIDHFDTYIDNAISAVNKAVSHLSGLLGADSSEDFINSEGLSERITSFFTGTGNLFETIFKYVQTYGSKLVVSLKNILIGLFISIYLLASKEKRYAQTSKFMHAFLKDKPYRKLYDIMGRADKTFGGFISGKIIDSLIIGILTFIVLTAFKMPYTSLISVIVGITNIIPYFGPFIGAIPSAFIILIAEPVKTIPFIIIILVIQQIDGNIIGPRILGDNTGLSSLGIILAILIMSGLFGVVGMIIGVPVGATIVYVISDIINDRLKGKGKSTNIDEYYADQAAHEKDKQYEREGSGFFYRIGVKIKESALRKLNKGKKPDSPEIKDDTVAEPSENESQETESVEQPAVSVDEHSES